MLWRCSELDGYEIAATDGTIGQVDDLLFEEARWTVRWLVADTGSWLSGRRVLLPPSALGHPDHRARRFPVNLTRRQVEESPPLTSDLPVSRQFETALYQYYGWSPYWDGDLTPPLSYLAGGVGGGYLFPPGLHAPERAPAEAAGDKPGMGEPAGDPMLRSVGDTTGHAISARDGDIGHVEDFLVDEEGWRIRYLVVDTRNWLPGRKVLVSPHWIRDIDWPEKRVHVDLTREAVKESPAYDPARPVERLYEEDLHRHYGRGGYWPLG
jgi:sporulation protein YlmC with PRC-barrel domain